MKPQNGCGLFGALSCLFLALASSMLVSAQSVSFQTVVSFHNQVAPEGTFSSGFSGPTPLLQGKDGYLYGTNNSGGTNSVSGTVFKTTTNGSKFVTLHVFAPSGTTGDGQYPQSGLVFDTNGSFYGTTQQGGSNGAVGTVFKVGASLPLHSFADVNNEGTQPVGGLVQGTDGKLYGTTSTGGANKCGGIFKITTGGTVTPLYSFPMTNFCGGGLNSPFGNLIQATDGSFYGTVWAAGDPTLSLGSVYKITSKGNFTTLHNFLGQPNDGANPGAGLLLASDGNFYGTTCYGGNSNNAGTVFRMAPNGNVTILVNFTAVGVPGQCPRAPLIEASDGNFYGTTLGGGLRNCSASTYCGTIFQVTPSGQYSTLYEFDETQNGGTGPWAPAGGLVQDTDGSFYGITSAGGDGTTSEGCNAGCGAVYHLTVSGVPPFVLTQQPSGKVGAVITIYGQGFTGTSAVALNGVPAVFSIKSNTYLTATVPAGATTGLITVTTPTGVLDSRYQFKVIPQVTGFTPTSGPPGTLVTITGVSLTQTTNITFGGIPATSFTIVSDTQVKATVPSGAKTGKIVITTQGGTATSTTRFTVT